MLALPARVDYLFAALLLFFVFALCNHHLHLSAPLSLHLGAIAPLNLVVGMFSCNRKGKFLLFCFSTVYYLPLPGTQVQELGVLTMCGVICFYACANLIFETQHENKVFFSAFFALGWQRACIYTFR